MFNRDKEVGAENIGPKSRIWKRPSFWIAATVIVALLFVAASLISGPGAPGQNPYKEIIGPNGQRVFENPGQAFAQAKIDYKQGFTAIRKEFKLWPVNKYNYKKYMTYGWQLTSGSEEAKRQGMKITRFFDMYENSFK